MQEKTEFCCKFGSFQFSVMPFGLMNAPAAFQRMAEYFFKAFLFVRVNIDDIVIVLSSIEEHVKRLIMVCGRVKQSALRLKLKSAYLAHRKKVLGYVVSEQGVEPDPAKIKKRIVGTAALLTE